MIYIDMSKSDLGRFPSVSDLDSNRFTKENRDGIVFTYGTTGSYGFLCARAELRRGWIDEGFQRARDQWPNALYGDDCSTNSRSEEHTSELQSLMRISYAGFCLKKKKTNKQHTIYYIHTIQYILTKKT